MGPNDKHRQWVVVCQDLPRIQVIVENSDEQFALSFGMSAAVHKYDSFEWAELRAATSVGRLKEDIHRGFDHYWHELAAAREPHVLAMKCSFVLLRSQIKLRANATNDRVGPRVKWSSPNGSSIWTYSIDARDSVVSRQKAPAGAEGAHAGVQDVTGCTM